ncbi:hypothetical protein HMPREF9999_01459 [Alloprevotella sp. oral taxon 473 str. F0040]|nr:hypothetical protein HMPREF9999_01459 [Alloprevotella sp. oral taxon 473 str. F0040]
MTTVSIKHLRFLFLSCTFGGFKAIEKEMPPASFAFLFAQV